MRHGLDDYAWQGVEDAGQQEKIAQLVDLVDEFDGPEVFKRIRKSKRVDLRLV